MRAHIAAVLLMVLCGCQMEDKPVELSPAVIAELTGDAVGVMLEFYPPAKTRLRLRSNTADDFGAALLESLRVHGYAVAEHVKTDKGVKSELPSDGSGFSSTLVFSKADGEARLVLGVGDESLSRLYAVQEGDDGVALVPKSAWSRKQ